MIRTLYIALMVCISFCTVAQPYVSRLGRFEVAEKKGCAPFTVNITIRPGFSCTGVGNPCNVDFGDGTAGTFVSSHTYTQPGKYTLRVLVQALGADDIEIEVVQNTQPVFDIYTCGNNAVSVNITDTNYNQYLINYNDGSPVITVPRGTNAKDQHTYATPGNKTISVKGRNLNAEDNCNSNTKPITALTILPAPTINLLQNIDNSSIKLDFTTQQNILYRLEIATNNATTFQLYKTSYNVSTETLSNVKPDDSYYCFRLGAFDPCNNITVYSPIICSANLDLNVQNNSNNVLWVTSAAGITDFRLNRATQGGAFTTTVTGSSYSDTNIFCGTNYCYQLTTNYPNGSRSISLQKCGTAISTDIPTPVQNITTIVQQPGVDIQWQPIVGYTPQEFSVYRSINGSAVNLLSKTAALQVRDEIYLTENSTCYKISYVDVCGNTSLLSEETCPIRLAGALQSNNAISLTWSSFSGWINGINDYQVEKYTLDGQLIQTFSVGLNSSLLDESQDDLINQSYRYVVKANSVEAGLPQSVSNSVVVTKSSNLFYPTAFTPNGDNLNDIFSVFGQYIVNFEINIFNRWGELMYSSSALEQGWDGNFRGNPMPEGTYTFIANISDKAGRTFKQSGSVLLLRKR